MRKMLIWSVFVLALFAFGGCGGGGGGKTTKLFGTTLGNNTLGASVLVQLSPSDGSFISTIGSVGYYVNGLEYDPVSNKLFGTTSQGDSAFPSGLIEIDMATAVATTIGQWGGGVILNPTVNSAGEMYAWTESGDDLLTVDPVTGAATVVGDSGVSSWTHGLAFDANDDLYFVNGYTEIYTIDAATGVATFFTDLTPLDTDVTDGIDNDQAHHGDFHPETGYYWGIGGAWPWDYSSVTSRKLIVIDMNTPAIIDSTLQTVDLLHAITFYRH